MKENGTSGESSRESTDLPLRQRYLLEKERIKQEIGDLEQIRHAIGLSKRRMCQLLLVDPSAWTRWTKSEAPPHVYQALRWLLELKKLNPSAAEVPGSLDRRVDLLQARTESRIRDVETGLAAVERSFSIVSSLPAIAPSIGREIARLHERIEALTAAKEAAAEKTAAKPQKPRRSTNKKKPPKKPKKKPAKNPAKKARPRRAKKRKALPLKAASRYRRRHRRS